MTKRQLIYVRGGRGTGEWIAEIKLETPEWVGLEDVHLEADHQSIVSIDLDEFKRLKLRMRRLNPGGDWEAVSGD